MEMKRRTFLVTAATAPLGFAAGHVPADSGSGEQAEKRLPAAIEKLQPMTDGIVPITPEERRSRVLKAQRLMREEGMDALLLEPGTSMNYFLDFRFFRSERMVTALIPAQGEVVYVAPAFEKDKVEENITIPGEVRTWHEHESPYELVADYLKGLKKPQPTLGVEERLRFFLVDGIRQEAPAVHFRLATPVTAGCRMIKSAAELALIQRAMDVTLTAYKALAECLREDMTRDELRELCAEAHGKLGFDGGIMANFAEASALPHGSSESQRLKKGDIILIDGGCAVEDYRSDISRTWVYGKPSQRQIDVWNVVKEAQAAAFAAVRPGVACSRIDAVARKIISDAGFGPDYTYFSHRVGHGIGMDGHEWTYLVRGNETPLEPGMCFSDEPGIYIGGEFGVRLEDCFYVTDSGAGFFTEPSPSIDQPFA
ncbi:MAG: aminopeptidase P family protein [bacterium]|nr:aminopeptidase P family protein [bacterium]